MIKVAYISGKLHSGGKKNLVMEYNFVSAEEVKRQIEERYFGE